MANTISSRRDGGAFDERRRAVERVTLEGASEGVSNSSGARLAQRIGGGSDHDSLQSSSGPESPGNDRALFPPGPADRELWAAIIAERPELAPAFEYEVRGMASRIAGGVDFARPDQLRSLGNMVVPQQGALALLTLLSR
jgi:hypothetical protein